jgi:hypothetical protein
MQSCLNLILFNLLCLDGKQARLALDKWMQAGTVNPLRIWTD